MAAIGDDALTKAAEADPLWEKYGAEIDRESAREKLAALLAAATEPAPEADAPPAPEPDRPRRRRPADGGDGENPIVDYLKSRQGRAMAKKVARGVFGMLRKRL
jgi:hypothetical protein